jgi:hypothetical protein
LKKDLLRMVGTSGNMALIETVDSASEKELLRMAEEYNLDTSDYIKEYLVL